MLYKINKACGLDGISTRLLKDAAPVIALSLTFIVNLSIRFGIFPDDWKIAKVTPIYKDEIKLAPIITDQYLFYQLSLN